MIETHFTNRDIGFLVAGILLILASIVFFFRGQKRLGLWLLVCGGAALRLMMVFIDPFVNIWDEQFHALVAKNLPEHFFTPTLVENPLAPTAPGNWAYTHTWLHKPPLFLWQMALSIKLFGTHPWAIRIPSMVLSTLMIPAVYRMGKLLRDERTGFVAALLLACSNILINIVSGFLNTDQNDVVFIAYICFSFWTWMEYINAPMKRWIVLTGIFAGCAVLTKWLPGLMVYGAWGISLLFVRENRQGISKWKDLFVSLCTAIIVAAPWFIYAAMKWPAEWQHTQENYSKHFSDAMTHEGEWWYHFAILKEQNTWFFIAALIGGVLLLVREKVRVEYKWGLITVPVVVFTFYAFVQARMPLFCVTVLPLLIVIAALCFVRLSEFFSEKHHLKVLAVCCIFLAVITIDTGRLEHYHTDRDPKEIYRKTRINNSNCFAETLKDIPASAVVFNCGLWNAVPCMFYANCTAFDELPDAYMISLAKEQHRKIYVFKSEGMPEWIAADPEITIVKNNLIRNGF